MWGQTEWSRIVLLDVDVVIRANPALVRGLEAPVGVEGYVLHTVKTANATYGHHGEMAWQQMYYF